MLESRYIETIDSLVGRDDNIIHAVIKCADTGVCRLYRNLMPDEAKMSRVGEPSTIKHVGVSTDGPSHQSREN